jgi:hypothetical protein
MVFKGTFSGNLVFVFLTHFFLEQQVAGIGLDATFIASKHI